MPYHIDKILAIAEKYGIPVVEDAAEGMGSRFNGQMTVLDAHIAHHKHVQSLYEELLADVPGFISTSSLQTLVSMQTSGSVRQLLILRCASRDRRTLTRR